MLTEEQAKKTKCCGPANCGTPSDERGIRFCDTTACAAWRWMTTPEYAADYTAKYPDYKPHILAKGFCGLAPLAVEE